MVRPLSLHDMLSGFLVGQTNEANGGASVEGGGSPWIKKTFRVVYTFKSG